VKVVLEEMGPGRALTPEEVALCRRHTEENADIIKEAMTLDREFFKSHHGVEEYVRRLIPGELPSLGTVPEGVIEMVRVRQISPGMRHRSAFWIVSND
jgi:hypothetical protein